MEIVRAFESDKNILIKGTFEEPLFRATDIANILEIGNIHKSTIDFSEFEKKIIVLDTPGGPQGVSFITEKGLYKLLFRSRKPIAEKFQDWVCEVIKEIRLNGQYKLQQQLKEKEEELQNKEKELETTQGLLKDKILEAEELRNTEKPPKIYIYNIDPKSDKLNLKIGYTKDVYERIKSYRQISKNGIIEFSRPFQGVNVNIKTIENYIHNVLSKYRVKDEVFDIDIETAKLILTYIVSITEIVELNNERLIKNKLQKIIEFISEIKDGHKINISTTEISTQTDEIEEIPNVLPVALIEKNERTILFNKFIEEECIVHPDAEVSSKIIAGQYRIWTKNADKEIYHCFKEYLNKRFVYGRIKKQDKNQVVNGYIGVKLKEIEYKKSLVKTDEETFIFHSCIFSPDGKVLFSRLKSEYIKWLKDVKNIITDIDERIKDLKNYLKNSPYTLKANVWENNGNGNGFYGIYLKGDEEHYKTSSTGKAVEKREVGTDSLIANYETIAKAADSEKIPACRMSRAIKNKVIFNDDYYYCISLSK